MTRQRSHRCFAGRTVQIVMLYRFANLVNAVLSRFGFSLGHSVGTEQSCTCIAAILPNI